MEKLKILNVDDEPINGMMFRSVFKDKYTVFTAESGFAGLEVLQINNDIDVVISDMRMPGMNGIEFIQRAKDLYPRIRYFVLTGYNVTPDIQKSIDSGLLCKCFVKPLNLKEIDESIQAKLSAE
jgi:two-component system response regulator (stage 0 sporulation protein F)